MDMAEGQQRDEWERTSLIVATIVNCRANRPANSKLYPPRRFNPFHTRPQITRTITDPHELCDLMGGQ